MYYDDDVIDDDFDETEEEVEVVIPVSERLLSKNFASLAAVFVVLELIVFVVPGLFFLLTGSGFLHAVFRAGLLATVAAPVNLLLAFPFRGITIFTAGTIRLESNGRLYVYDTTDEHTVLYAARLQDCRCFFGDRTWSTHPFRSHLFGSWLSGRALLLELPKKCRTASGPKPTGEPIIIEIGRTEEVRQRWINAFTRVRVPRDIDREKLLSPYSVSWLIFWSIAAFHLALGLGYLFGIVLAVVLHFAGVSRDWITGIGFACLLPGSPLLALYSTVAVFRRRTRLCGIHRPSVGQKPQWNVTLQILGLVAGNIALYWTFSDDDVWSLSCRTAATLTAALLGLLAIGVGRAMYAEDTKR